MSRSSAVSKILREIDDGSPVAMLPVTMLVITDSPRLDGVNDDHARTLAEILSELPPIVVQRGSMRVIDGLHRLRAAQFNGDASIAARLVDDDDHSAYVRSVVSNVNHGLPLSLADRQAAAGRMITMFPDWSDRFLGRVTGLSGKTIGALRRRLGLAVAPQRTGQDGRVRPSRPGTHHQAVSEMLARRPEASLREVARAVGVSPNTVRKVRERTSPSQPVNHRLGDSPGVPAVPAARQEPVLATVVHDEDLLANLSRDPSLRYTDAGRRLLRLLHHEFGTGVDEGVLEALPPHCLPGLARLARSAASRWASLADMVEGHRQVRAL
ncbi:ParB/RepB/Spo0J family partition protein [Actinoplanes sp. NPDC051346]|uniref:ParB/RepB/Spo0J family partition protein n=1 Tax=Actinoplanes sp. NPDC051346 TaxID=3155048 RepID=UPI0034374CD2